jgi:hypothetical protein
VKSLPKINKDFDESADFTSSHACDPGYLTGTFYRKGRVVQVIYKNGETETWTAPDEEQAKYNFRELVERFNE